MPEAKFGYRNESSRLLTRQNEMQAVHESTGRAYRLSLESRSRVRPTLSLTVSRLTRKYTETGFGEINKDDLLEEDFWPVLLEVRPGSSFCATSCAPPTALAAQLKRFRDRSVRKPAI
jgi:hypothetical protein